MARKDTENYISLSALSEQSGITRTTLYSHIKRGNLRTRKVGFFTVVSESEANQFLKRLTRLNLGGREVTVFQ